jgi:hypothetical protein
MHRLGPEANEIQVLRTFVDDRQAKAFVKARSAATSGKFSTRRQLVNRLAGSWLMAEALLLSTQGDPPLVSISAIGYYPPLPR